MPERKSTSAINASASSSAANGEVACPFTYVVTAAVCVHMRICFCVNVLVLAPV